MTIEGHVDTVNASEICGWAINWDNPQSRCVVVAMCNNLMISEATANLEREDLKAKSIGDGHHAFQLPLPPRLPTDSHIHILDKKTNKPLTSSPISLNKSNDTPQNDEPILLVDLSDMLLYLEPHSHLSGIQRVQANILTSITDNFLLPFNNLKVLYYRDLTGEFYEIDLYEVLHLVADTQRKPGQRYFSRDKNGRLNIEQQLTMKPLNIGNSDYSNSVLLNLGAAWQFPAYFHAVRKLKQTGIYFIALIHDLIPIRMPHTCDQDTAEVFKIFLPHVVRTADHILTVSENTRQDLVDYCNEKQYDPPSITVSQNGQTLDLLSVNASPPLLDEQYVLFVATIESRKNHRLALEVWRRLIKEYGDKVPTLVFVGRVGWHVEDVIDDLYTSHFLNDKVMLLNDISDEQLASLYRNCLFTIYPSLYEGWGLPVGESLAFGKVCVASNASAIPEVGGNFTIYFDPSNVDDALNRVKEVLFDKQYKQRLEKEISKKFVPIKWIDVGENIIGSVRSVIQQPQRSTRPTIDAGEYGFAYPKAGSRRDHDALSIQGELRKVSEPKITFFRLGLEHYVMGEEMLGRGLWYSPEYERRWGHTTGNSLSFKVKEDASRYIAYLLIEMPGPLLPASIAFSSNGRFRRLYEVESENKILCLDLGDYAKKQDVEIEWCIQKAESDSVPGDPRDLGLGLQRVGIIRKDDYEHRLGILEDLTIRRGGIRR